MRPRQRQALLAGVDTGGRIPDGVVSARVLNSIPEAWARTDEKTGDRFLTAEGRAALIPFDRYRKLRGTNPESGMRFVRPAFADRLPVHSRAVWKREGQPDVLVQVDSWPFDDGTVLVYQLNNRMHWRPADALAAELHPAWTPARWDQSVQQLAG